MNLVVVSVREASFVAGVPVKTVNKAIDEARLRRGIVRRRRERLLNRDGVLQLAFEKELERRISNELRPSVRAGFLKAITTANRQADVEIRLGDSLVLVIECKAIEARIDRRWEQLSRALDEIAEDPEVQAGAPTFRGTRVLVWPIVEALKQGEPEAELLKHYPALTHEKLEAAKLYVEVHPRRGRPKIDLRHTAPKSSRIVRPSSGGLTVRPRLLIDENLSVELPLLVRERGYECMHVRDLGLLSEKDWHLLERIRMEDWTLVTNNVEEFRARYRRRVDLHAGVVFLVSSAGIDTQTGALNAALDDIDGDGNLLNTEVLVEPYGGGYRVRRFDLP